MTSLSVTTNACGGFFCQPQQPVLQAGENIAFGVQQIDENTVAVQMAVQINYQGPAEAFAWVLPVPALPEISVGSDLLFQGLFEATRPNFVFEVDNARSTCSDGIFEDLICPELEQGNDGGAFMAPEMAADSEAVVLEEGTVGPFQFVTLESAEDRPESVFEWLNENGYDQPDEARPLVDYYAGMSMKFVALQLQKEAESGDIRPIILKYKIPGNLANSPVACIPIQLTSIAATPGMPIQVYTLAPYRGVPKNYVHAELDLRYLDWLGCSNGVFFGPDQNCYLNDYRNLLEIAAVDVDGHTFVTEFAGSTSAVSTNIALSDFDLQTMYGIADPLTFLIFLSEATVPDIALVHSTIERHIPNKITNGSQLTPPFCLTLTNIYNPGDNAWQMNSCVEFVDFGESSFDPVALADELQEQVIQPARDAQDWVNSYLYLTRLYAQLDPEEMNKDPFFAFDDQLEDVSNQIAATGIPVCGAVGPIGMDIVLNDPPAGLEDSVYLEATFACGTWFRRGGGPIFGESNPAFSFTGFNFAGLEGATLFRDSSTGQFNSTALGDLITVLDDSVPDQTVPSRFNGTSSSGAVHNSPLVLSKMTSLLACLLVSIGFY
jgi:hypothetical protein